MIKKIVKITNYWSIMIKKNLKRDLVDMARVPKNWEKTTVEEEVQELVVWDSDPNNKNL
jgi:hypothetical protein